MSTGTRLAGLLLFTTALTVPSVLAAQDTQSPDDTAVQAEGTPPEQEIQDTDISVPGGGIIVTGRRNRDPARNSGQVLNVLSEADIARTGEGDIAGALARVSGLSLVGNGRVFVRGLGDRYSLALLNGLPLPSPEPLSRVVPLDIFPTSVIASSLVQKTYSANFPGEFGGGVINLTTKAIPTEDFLTVSFTGSGDTETTFQNGLTYFGSRWDTFGFDNGNRDFPTALQGLIDSGTRVNDAPADVQRQLAGQIMPLNLVTLQKNDVLPMNFSANLTGGGSFEVGDGNYLGIIATAGITNSWRNRSVTSQQFGDAEAGDIIFDSQNFITDNKVLVNALVGVGLDIGEHTIRWTNLYIRDTLKTARLAQGTDAFTDVSRPFDFQTQQTGWFERQLMDTQLVAEFNFDKLELDLRGGYARTDREAPYNAIVPYIRTNIPGDPFGDKYVVDVGALVGGTERIQVGFEDLQEELWFGGADVTYAITDTLSLTAGYAYTETTRRSLSFIVRPLIGSSADLTTALRALGLRRPGDIINGATLATDADGVGFFNVTVSDPTPFPVFDAALTIHAGYGLARFRPTDRVNIEAGVRYEDGLQVAAPDLTFGGGNLANPTRIANDYFLPSATVTWEPIDDLQLRFAASQTIARPQFRELVEQTYFDPESNRRFRGNPFLQDSELINLEARAEYYMGGPNRVSLAGFFKKIDNPIENFLITAPGIIETSYANAPEAELYGAELDVAYGIDLADWGGLFETKQFLIIGNYTYTQSNISVGAADLAPIPGAIGQPASQLFDDGAPLVGQSDHVANLSFGIEDTDKVQQFTVLFNYASERVTLRGGALPDVVEDPGLTIDLVARSEVKLGGVPVELSFEARNITGRDNFEFQQLGANRAEINTFDVGTSFAIGIKAQF
ncbi:TonB-dependent receptor domain-containing protein [Porphyrobacter sp. AAP60]|uniref:TonB-dependent receptor domain-containing protein n=1 Tax=Porphyrobacter sp. AAP60 TaxID=1523423 RepID=UPI0006B97D30|nr:TonB-dependent receptor [Porphyrobacter sp. AAP60]KPF62239.1 TonB-dependent receptor [Porphyrobacter sp. AAP60]